MRPLMMLLAAMPAMVALGLGRRPRACPAGRRRRLEAVGTAGARRLFLERRNEVGNASLVPRQSRGLYVVSRSKRLLTTPLARQRLCQSGQVHPYPNTGGRHARDGRVVTSRCARISCSPRFQTPGRALSHAFPSEALPGSSNCCCHPGTAGGTPSLGLG